MKAAKRQWLVKVDGIDGYWGKMTGGELKASVNKVFDGGSNVPDILTGSPEVQDVTVARPYDPLRDQDMLNRLKTRVGTWVTTISRTPTETDLTASKVKGDVFANAVLVAIKFPESDASSADHSEVELIFSVPMVA